MTAYEYDDDGRMVASITTAEPEWSPLDFAEMQALAIYEASLCPSCKRPVDLCKADFDDMTPISVDKHVCAFASARDMQQRFDQWESADVDKRPAEPPVAREHGDGLIYVPRHSTQQEIDDAAEM